MDRSYLIQKMQEQTPSERHMLSNPSHTSSFYKYLTDAGYQDPDGIYHLPDSSFMLPQSSININNFWDKLDHSPRQSFFRIKRASRYYKEPLYYADFIALRYVYSGKCIITTKENSFTLERNDICIFNKGFVLSQYLPEDDDIVFTLMFDKEYLIKNIFQMLKGNNVVSQFITNYIMENDNPQNYIIFHGNQNDRIPNIFEDLLCEYIDPTPQGDVLIESYLRILLVEMIYCNYEYSANPNYHAAPKIAEILKYIDSNFDHVSLNELSKDFGYNSKYLSRLIKNSTGSNLKDIVLNKKMDRCTVLLTNTNLPIHEVMLSCGFSNETFFYKKFTEKFGQSPKEYRDSHKG